MEPSHNNPDLQQNTNVGTQKHDAETDSASKPKASSSNRRSRAARRLTRNPQDIICGRGFHIKHHRGNIRLHQTVNRYRQTYQTATRKVKNEIAQRIVEEIKSTGARFIRRVEDGNDDDDVWEEVDDETCYNKIGHALRLRKEPQRKSKTKPKLATPQVAVPNQQDSTVGLFDGTVSGGLRLGIVPPPSANSLQIPMVQASPMMPSAFLPSVSWNPFLNGNQLLQGLPFAPPQPVSHLLLHPSPSILDPYGQLLINPLFALNSTLANMAQASVQQRQQQQIPRPQPGGQMRRHQGVQEESSASRGLSKSTFGDII